MRHERFIPEGKIELRHEYRDLPGDDDATMKHFVLEANAKGLLLLTESTLSGPVLPPPLDERGVVHGRPHRVESVEFYEITAEDLVGCIRRHGTKLELGQLSSARRGSASPTHGEAAGARRARDGSESAGDVASAPSAAPDATEDGGSATDGQAKPRSSRRRPRGPRSTG
jgi:hypothetical protein